VFQNFHHSTASAFLFGLFSLRWFRLKLLTFDLTFGRSFLLSTAWHYILLLLHLEFLLLLLLEVKFFGNTREDLLYVESCLGTSFKCFMNFLSLSKFQSSLESNFPLILKFSFVTDEIHSDVLTSVLFDFL